ncbi:HAMP domain-containing histidine kinase [Actinoallomurus purpureus]|uniref:sensor histidine kinase n=1 Tax=Actinoallomurus purpureus TaxID=478114 RepID=UPI0020931886|nr:HAMP domain-containing sensor histidine kinase [Actinoallomurus purpureus]MCO6005499.1 HAMP domain-containing histidine kinase [Actinoallomurus purpureus]
MRMPTTPVSRLTRSICLPNRTVRSRFTALYGVVFFLSGAGLLAIANFVTLGSRQVSHAVPGPEPVPQEQALTVARDQIAWLQNQLAEQHAAQARQLLAGSAIALAVMVVASIVLGRLIAGRVLRPLRTITSATRRITADNLHERLAVSGPADEVKDLADTIDELLERLEGAFAAQRRFVADASHELRTPLTTMRASLDVAVAKPEPAPPQTVALADRLRGELDQVDRLLEGLLVLARTQHGDLPDRATLSLARLASEAVETRSADIAARRLTVHEATGGDAPVRGSQALLRRMVDNLIDNAIRHNEDGGWIRVVIAADGEFAHLVVETGGDVLDPRQVAELTRPFRRLGADRTGTDDGTGLGLAIVAAVATAHGGILDLRARPGGGLRVGVSLPSVVHAGVPA